MARATFPVVVHVLLFSGERVFFLRRAKTGFMDGYYSLPGGHQQSGESVTEAAVRECREETGAVPTVLEPVCVMPYTSGRHQGLNFVFEATRYEGEPGINEPELFDAALWCDVAELPEPRPPWFDDVLGLRREGRWFAEYHWR